MEVDVFGGSKGGGSRTTSSLLLAAGARELGLHPLHVQVLPPGRAPALDNVRQVPFETALIPVDEPEVVAAQIRLLVQRRPECFPVIVDMPCQRICRTMLMLDGIEARVLLPMRDGAAELGRAIHDYRDALRASDTGDIRRQPSDRCKPPIQILPVGWSPSLRSRDFAAILRNRGLGLDDQPPYPVVCPGIPKFDPLDLDLVDLEGCFELTEQQWDAATCIAQVLYTQPRNHDRSVDDPGDRRA
jgi:hypothetical protein